MGARKTVIIGLLGLHKDSAQGPGRWDSWRPTVSLFRHDELEPERLILISEPKAKSTARRVEEDIRSVSPNTAVEHVELGMRDPWDFAEVYAKLRAFADEQEFDPDAEDYLIHVTTGTHVAQICLFLLVESGHLPGRLIQSSPVSEADRRGRRFDGRGTYSIIDLDLSRYDQLATRFEAERREGVDFLKGGIATRNERFNALMDRIERVALQSVDPILLGGATGVGKTQLARRIFELKARSQTVSGSLVEVNCATLRGDQAMSALFGHEKGAFTGAMSKRDGLLRTADGGVVFLDEVGELGLDEQAMLLRAIEEKSFLPVGADSSVSADFQLLAGTNRDLGAEVRAGRFREDLLARIDLWTFQLPSLSERLEDVEPNLDFELERLSDRFGRRITINKEARARFLAFAAEPASTWRANFRDFSAAINRMATLSDSGRITVHDVSHETERLRAAWAKLEGDEGETQLDTPNIAAWIGDDAARELDRFDAVQLGDAIDVCRRSKSLSAAGRELFAASRKRKSSSNDADRLRKYLARFGLDWATLTADGT